MLRIPKHQQPLTAPAASTAPTPALNEPKPAAKSAIIMEASTGAVLYELNADEAFPPASMAKMMTEYLAHGEHKRR